MQKKFLNTVSLKVQVPQLTRFIIKNQQVLGLGFWIDRLYHIPNTKCLFWKGLMNE